MRPVERDVAAGAHLGNSARSRVVDLVAGNVGDGGVGDGGNITTTKGNAIWGWIERAIDADIPARVTGAGEQDAS